ncbi:uncharacterized protein A4U43_C07F33420 [Asparagus officinalis]|uniref:Uncharacterized protein n=1 Tax=Asparagus officinalis TaxID=4686 RepID=A0A5P1EGU0_ASPOF|nr:uncharacterized protein A4U43_C07F33420 [Asparagus officinalis]
MCRGQHLSELAGTTCPPRLSTAMATERARVAASNAELAAVRARLAESMAQLERERARSAELRRRLAESFIKRDRIKDPVSSLAATRGRVANKRSRIDEASGNDSDDADDEFTILYFQQIEGLVKKRDLSERADDGAKTSGRRACDRRGPCWSEDDDELPSFGRRRRRRSEYDQGASTKADQSCRGSRRLSGFSSTAV